MRNLIPHCIQEYYQQGRSAGEFEALTLFVDVSGFTPMTQALMKHGHEGAEILAAVLNDIFDELVDAVYERGGFVSTFAGDAFTAIFPFRDDSIPTNELLLHVFACVANIQALFRRHGIQTTPLGQFALQFHVGLSGGIVEWGIVGETDKAFFFRGTAIDGCAASEHQAEKGEVIFDDTVAHYLRKVPGASDSARHIRSLQVDRLAGGYYRLTKLPQSLLEEFALPNLPEPQELDPDILSRFFPEPLVHLAAMGEFRRVVSIFLSFDGITTIHELNEWACLLLDNITTFDGYFNRISFGDKGGFVLCGFGAPVTYENIVHRALSWIFSVKDGIKRTETLSTLKIRAGVTYGMAYAGIAGGEKRCEYTYHGEVVNLAARFMMKADWGEILVSDAVRENTVHFNFTHKGDFVYKGVADPVSTWILTSRKPGTCQKFTEAMIGRLAELHELQQFVAPLFDHTFAGIACIYGEAGIGKSRLAYALQEIMMQQHPVQWFNCPADQIVHKPFQPFITLFMRYFEQTPEHTEVENKTTFEEKYEMLINNLREILSESDHFTLPLAPLKGGNPPLTPPRRGRRADNEADSPLEGGQGGVFPYRERAEVGHSPFEGGQEVVFPSWEGLGVGILNELGRTKSVIGAQLGLSWKKSLWKQLNAKGRYENTVSAIKNFFLAQSLLRPVVIALEDGQWLDSDSLVAVQTLTRNVNPYPLLILSTIRYSEYGSKPCLLNPQNLTERHIPYKEIEVREFSEADLRNFAGAHLEGVIAESFYALLFEKTNGNPFFAEQLLHYVIENDLVERTEGRWQLKAGDIPLPDSLNAVLIARIDRLTDEVKEVVKTAAVIGREFDVRLLSEMLKKKIQELLPEVKLVEKSRIWHVLQELLYMFKHALLRDIAYQMQLKARLRELHQLAAETMERVYESHLARWYADLAFHYEKAENRDKAVEYLQKAGDEAKAQYQNQQALALYDRLLAHLQEMFGFTEVEIDTLLKKAEILELIGEWKACQAVCKEALELSEQIDDKCRMGEANRALGFISRGTGKYDSAMAYFEQAIELFEIVNERAGIGGILTGMGTIYRRKGDGDTAIAYYEKALKSSEERGDHLQIAMNADNMGVVYQEVKGDYDMAMTWFQKSLQIFEDIGEKLEMSKVLNNIGECHRSQGNYDDAMVYYDQALKINEELGYKLEISIDFENIGLVYMAKGDYITAIECFDRAIAIGRELESKFYLCSCLIDKANALFSLQHYDEARALNAEGLRIAEEIEDPEYTFKGKVLSAKIAFAVGNKDALCRFETMLQQTENDVEIATIHYELGKMNHNEDHWQTALNLYQRLYATTPNIEYKRRIEEMQNYKNFS